MPSCSSTRATPPSCEHVLPASARTCRERCTGEIKSKSRLMSCLFPNAGDYDQTTSLRRLHRRSDALRLRLMSADSFLLTRRPLSTGLETSSRRRALQLPTNEAPHNAPAQMMTLDCSWSYPLQLNRFDWDRRAALFYPNLLRSAPLPSLQTEQVRHCDFHVGTGHLIIPMLISHVAQISEWAGIPPVYHPGVFAIYSMQQRRGPAVGTCSDLPGKFTALSAEPNH